jgi:hypothetical protein
MADVSGSGGITSDGKGSEERLLTAIGSLRPGRREPTKDEQAVIDEYAYISEQLAAPQFGSPAPQITRVEASDGDLRIYGKHLRGVRVIKVGGDRITRPRFQMTDDAEPHIRAELPKGAVAGPVTVITTGGPATSQLRLEDLGATERTEPSPPEDPR